MKKPRDPSTREAVNQREAAAELAIAALTFLASDEDRLGRFLALTGIAPASLRAAAREPGTLLGVLDHVTGDEALLLAFANESGIDPEDATRAREALAGRPAGETGGA